MESINCHSIYAVTVWYHPSAREAELIRLYQNDVAGVIVVDNSETDNRHLLSANSDVIYLPQMANTGIAAALNTGCREALARGGKWALTMDQDSEWNQHTVKQYIAAVNQYEKIEEVAVFSPFHDCDHHPEKHHRRGVFEPRAAVMCSGNLLRLSAWQEAGGFCETFFIDYVDDEMCCRLREKGWFVVRANEILLTHSLGNGAKRLPLGKQYIPHPAWRYYYIARNLKRMIALYPSMRGYYRSQASKYLKRLLLYDWDDKWNKLREFRRGWREL